MDCLVETDDAASRPQAGQASDEEHLSIGFEYEVFLLPRRLYLVPLGTWPGTRDAVDAGPSYAPRGSDSMGSHRSKRLKTRSG
mmetsp:Transcript_4409/g.15470  ORF Transcript_4409/g.15470 Transcript_4409/m.15470 type:complete len:83 (-) Transcript_4409:33-281(-)